MRTALVLAGLLILGTQHAHAAPRAASTLAYGKGSFIHSGPEHNVRVWYYQPNPLRTDTRIVIVLHGSERQAESFLGPWTFYAERHDLMVVVPEFSRSDFRTKRHYQHGDVESWFGVRPRDKWLFATLERIFDDVRERAELTSETYGLYGHSAGAQFVHRMAILWPEARFDRAIAANAGVYMMPTEDVPFPYGLRGAGVSDTQLRAALGRDLIVLTGLNDTAVSGKLALTHRHARAQGIHRVARAERFYALADLASDRLGVDLQWRLLGVPGVGHNHAGMTRAAVKLLR